MMWLVLFGTISSLFVFLSIIIGCGKKQIAQTTIASRNLIKSSRSSSLCSSSSLESGSVNSEKRYLDTHLFRRPVKRTRIIQKTAQQLRVQAAIEADRIAAIAAHQSSQELENQGLKRVIEVNPREIMFKSVGGVKSAVVQNKGNEIYVFRIKCSDSDVYEVDPICSYVEPRSSKMLKVMRFNAADKIDYLTLVMGKVVEFSGNKEQDWENTVEREEVIIIIRMKFHLGHVSDVSIEDFVFISYRFHVLHVATSRREEMDQSAYFGVPGQPKPNGAAKPVQPMGGNVSGGYSAPSAGAQSCYMGVGGNNNPAGASCYMPSPGAGYTPAASRQVVEVSLDAGLSGGSTVTALPGGMSGGSTMTALPGCGMSGGSTMTALPGGMSGGSTMTALPAGFTGGSCMTAIGEMQGMADDTKTAIGGFAPQPAAYSQPQQSMGAQSAYFGVGGSSAPANAERSLPSPRNAPGPGGSVYFGAGNSGGAGMQSQYMNPK